MGKSLCVLHGISPVVGVAMVCEDLEVDADMVVGKLIFNLKPLYYKPLACYSHGGVKQAHLVKIRHILPDLFRLRPADNALDLVLVIAAGENEYVEQQGGAEEQRDPLYIPATNMHSSVPDGYLTSTDDRVYMSGYPIRISSKHMPESSPFGGTQHQRGRERAGVPHSSKRKINKKGSSSTVASGSKIGPQLLVKREIWCEKSTSAS